MADSALVHALRLGAVAALALTLLRQCRKPRWLPGRLFATLMNRTHRELTTWGLSHLSLAKDSSVLDVGCGGGQAIQQLALLVPAGQVYGIDYSAASVAVARRTNASLIDSARVDIRLGSVSSLPFSEAIFDVVTAIETHYYWPNLEADLREIHRVLKPNGRVAIVAEAYRRERGGAVDRGVMRVLGSKLLSADEHHDVLAAAGFVDVIVFEERRRGWICAVGVRRG